MSPVIVRPRHDPAGLMFPHLRAITPLLKDLFGQGLLIRVLGLLLGR